MLLRIKRDLNPNLEVQNSNKPRYVSLRIVLENPFASLEYTEHCSVGDLGLGTELGTVHYITSCRTGYSQACLCILWRGATVCLGMCSMKPCLYSPDSVCLELNLDKTLINFMQTGPASFAINVLDRKNLTSAVLSLIYSFCSRFVADLTICKW